MFTFGILLAALVPSAALLRTTAVPSQPASAACAEYERSGLEATERLATRGDDGDLRIGIERRLVLPEGRCPAVRLARAAVLGWLEARALESKGGAPELLGPTERFMADLSALRSGDLALETDYAQTAIRAAIAAAQDERSEMELLLSHARDLSERLVARGRRALWPQPFNVLAGQLWLEVDRYEDARRAFDRAVVADASPVALLGLARSLARLDRREDACAAYRRLRGAAPVATEEARVYLATCP